MCRVRVLAEFFTLNASWKKERKKVDISIQKKERMQKDWDEEKREQTKKKKKKDSVRDIKERKKECEKIEKKEWWETAM